MLKIPVEAANNPEAGTWLGRLHMQYKAWRQHGTSDVPQPAMSLSTEAYEALQKAQEAHNDYLKAIGAPGAYYEPISGSGDEEAHIKWRKHAIERWTKIVDAIQEEYFEVYRTTDLGAALTAVLQEQEAPHLINDIRCLGNCLARYFERGRK